jgi:uncharacterized membrane protein
MDSPARSFAKDVRPMFTDTDVAHMKPAGLDLSSRDDVEKHADAIYRVVRDGSMPPGNSGEARWTDEMCQRFREWQNQGCPP